MRLFAERAALREDAARLLGELGGTAGEVAMSLWALGVPAGTSSPGDTPTARYLNAVLGADTQVRRVRVTKRWLVLETERRWGATIRLRLPRPVREFTVLVAGATSETTQEESDAKRTRPSWGLRPDAGTG